MSTQRLGLCLWAGFICLSEDMDNMTSDIQSAVRRVHVSIQHLSTEDNCLVIAGLPR